jgi:hypothetical protein
MDLSKVDLRIVTCFCAIVSYLVSTLLVEIVKFFKRYKKWRKEHPIDKEE